MRKRLCVLAVMLLMLLLNACGPEQKVPASLPDKTEGEIVSHKPKIAAGRELLASADTQEAAEEIAELYGIELVEWSGFLAVYHTAEEPREVVQRGRENDWPALEVNYVIPLD